MPNSDEEPTDFVGYKNSMIYRLTPEELQDFAAAEKLAEDLKQSIERLTREALARPRVPSDAVDLRKEAARGETSPVEETPDWKAATALMSQEEYRIYIGLTRRLSHAFGNQHKLMSVAEERESRPE